MSPINYIQADQVILEKNDVAKFKGVLVPELVYKEMHVDIFQKQYLKTELDICLQDKKELEGVNKYNFFIAGAFIGVLATIYVKK